MTSVVVDTNVPVVANGKSDDVHPDCVLACIAALEKVHNDGVIVIDDHMLILREYMNNLSMKGQPGVGDYFMKWVFTNQAVQRYCEVVGITPRHGTDWDFEEFPADPALAKFDKSDRKFVAVALASENSPVVLNAVDSDWGHSYEALVRNGVKVDFLCPQHVCARIGND